MDVSIRSKIGPYDILTVIECRDHKRPVNVTYIEQMVTKRDNIRANKLIVISRNGFSKTAKDLAMNKGIGLLRFSDSKDLKWDEFIDTSIITIHHKKYDILTVDFVLINDKTIEPLDGMIEFAKNDAIDILFNKDHNPVEYQSIIQDVVTNESERLKQYFPESGDRILPLEVNIHYPLYVKFDEYYRPILKLKVVLKLYIEHIVKPLNLLMKRKLTDEDSGEEFDRYFEVGFSFKDQDLKMGFIQGNFPGDSSEE